MIHKYFNFIFVSLILSFVFLPACGGSGGSDSDSETVVEMNTLDNIPNIDPLAYDFSESASIAPAIVFLL